MEMYILLGIEVILVVITASVIVGYFARTLTQDLRRSIENLQSEMRAFQSFIATTDDTWRLPIFETLDKSTSSPIVVIDSESIILFCNESLAKLSGYSRSQLIGKPLGLLIPPRFLSFHNQTVENLASGEREWIDRAVSMKIQSATGEEIPLLALLARHVRGKQVYFVALFQVVEDDNRSQKHQVDSILRDDSAFGLGHSASI